MARVPRERELHQFANRGTAVPKEMHMLVSDAVLSDLLRRVRAEYQESPGMSLTRAQVQRLWSLDAGTCDAVLEKLIAAGFLTRTRTDGYVRADGWR
jgi:hypothetical protein